MAITDYAIIPKADYIAACDKIREHSGKTDVIKSGDLATEIEAIASSGGSSADVRYVTFIFADGRDPYVKPVAVGDDCADIVARGLVSTPTKESTEAEVYTYSGWSLTEGGEADPAALANVTEDRTVYAAFTAKARLYWARFYDDSGALMQESQEAYGTQATPPDTTKDGYAFVGWTPSDLTIYEDTDFVGTWEVDRGWLVQLAFPYENFTTYISKMVYSADGTRLFAACGTTLYMYDATVQPYAVLATATLPNAANDMVLNPAGTWLAVAHNNSGTAAKGQASFFKIDEAAITSYQATWDTDGADGYSVAYSPDGTYFYILTSNKLKSYQINKPTNFILSTTISLLYNIAKSKIIFSPDGTKLFKFSTGSTTSKNITVYDPASSLADVTSTYLGNYNYPPYGYPVYSPDGNTMYVAASLVNSTYTTPQFFTLDTTSTPYPIQFYDKTQFTCGNANAIAISPDGKLIALATNSGRYIWIYDTETFTLTDAPFVLPTGYAMSCAFNHDGTRLAVGHANSPYLTLYEVKQ